MKNIIFIAPPAAGKGTQAKLVSEEYNIPHISTGDLLREEINKGSELGLEIKSLIDKGIFINDEIISNMLMQRLSKSDCDNGFILDGYPRNIEQAHIYENILVKLNKDLGVVIFLNVDKETALSRISGRLVCKGCGMSYNTNVSELSPKVENVCNKCNSTLVKRDDDNEAVFGKRFDTYLEQTNPLIEYYKNKNVLKIVDVTTPEETSIKIKKLLNR